MGSIVAATSIQLELFQLYLLLHQDNQVLKAARQYGSKRTCVAYMCSIDRSNANALQPDQQSTTASAASTAVRMWQDPQQVVAIRSTQYESYCSKCCS